MEPVGQLPFKKMKMYFKSGGTNLFISVDFRLCLSSRQDQLRRKLQKPPKGYGNPLEAYCYLPPGDVFPSLLQKDGVMFPGDYTTK